MQQCPHIIGGSGKELFEGDVASPCGDGASVGGSGMGQDLRGTSLCIGIFIHPVIFFHIFFFLAKIKSQKKYYICTYSFAYWIIELLFSEQCRDLQWTDLLEQKLTVWWLLFFCCKKLKKILLNIARFKCIVNTSAKYYSYHSHIK